MHSTSVYALKLSVLRGTGGKALATDQLGGCLIYKSAFTSLIIMSLNQNKGQYFFLFVRFCSLRIFLIKRSPIILRLNNSVIPNGQHGVKCWTSTWWLLRFPTITDKSIIIDFYPGSILIEATTFFSFIDFYRLISKSIFIDDWYRFLTNIINYRFIDYNQSRSSVPPN